MARELIMKFEDVILLVESLTVPGTFVAPCGFEELNYNIDSDTIDTPLYDCDDASLPAIMDVQKKSITRMLEGNGKVQRTLHKEWKDWAASNDVRTIRYTYDTSTAEGGGYYEADAKLMNYRESGSRDKGHFTSSITLRLITEPVWVPAP